MYLPSIYKIYYDTDRFPFQEVVKEMLNVSILEHLHREETYDLLSREQDQKTEWHSTRASIENSLEVTAHETQGLKKVFQETKRTASLP